MRTIVAQRQTSLLQPCAQARGALVAHARGRHAIELAAASAFIRRLAERQARDNRFVVRPYTRLQAGTIRGIAVDVVPHECMFELEIRNNPPTDRLIHLEDIGPHYATTLRHWRENFLHNLEAVRALGYPEEFIRMWEFYLCYCEGGFAERALGNVHMLFAKPDNRRAPIVSTLPV